MSVKKHSSGEENPYEISLHSTKSGGGYKFLLLDCMFKARRKGMFCSYCLCSPPRAKGIIFSQTPVTPKVSLSLYIYICVYIYIYIYIYTVPFAPSAGREPRLKHRRTKISLVLLLLLLLLLLVLLVLVLTLLLCYTITIISTTITTINYY